MNWKGLGCLASLWRRLLSVKLSLDVGAGARQTFQNDSVNSCANNHTLGCVSKTCHKNTLSFFIVLYNIARDILDENIILKCLHRRKLPNTALGPCPWPTWSSWRCAFASRLQWQTAEWVTGAQGSWRYCRQNSALHWIAASRFYLPAWILLSAEERLVVAKGNAHDCLVGARGFISNARLYLLMDSSEFQSYCWSVLFFSQTHIIHC